MGKKYVGQKLEQTLDVGVDVSSATVREILFKNDSGEQTLAATLDGTRNIVATVTLSVVGQWYRRAKITFGGDVYYGDVTSFEVKPLW